MGMDEESRNFLDKLEVLHPALRAKLDLVFKDVKVDTKEQLVRKLEK